MGARRLNMACSPLIATWWGCTTHRTSPVGRGGTTVAIGKGNKPALIPLPMPVARTMGLAAADRSGARMHGYAATRIVRRLAKRAEIIHRVGCHALRHSYITAAGRRRTPGSRPNTAQEPAFAGAFCRSCEPPNVAGGGRHGFEAHRDVGAGTGCGPAGLGGGCWSRRSP